MSMIVRVCPPPRPPLKQNDKSHLSTPDRPELILLVFCVVTPLTWIRHVGRLAITNAIADVFIILSLITIYSMEIMAVTGHLKVPNVGPDSRPSDSDSVIGPNIHAVGSISGIFVCLGTVCFTFEGICLVIPTKDAMARPQDFTKLFVFSQTIVVTLFGMSGLLGYFAFGSNTQGIILLNFEHSVAVRKI
jgi:amino acid permease